ncbi:ParB/RepB/Spo0J family partition protein [Kitasatospora sp. HPMI-4]|uniref:ParB/RepB/Spo0J family partition protein n=1 Tax=Kitasatospora sp. HPMI-4 TaxID=3448443 RepID=UPI003F1B9C14
MSIARKLAGGGGSFGALGHNDRRGQEEAIARSEALDATGRVRRASRAPVASIAQNPLNPRKTIIDETLDELGASLARRQIVPITVVSRAAFLDAHPEQLKNIGTADFVALDGNRRILAAQRVGLEELRVDLNDDLAATAADLLEASLVANIQREDVDPFEEAQAIQQLLGTVCQGNQAAAARKLGKSAAWVGQRLALLHLTTELQEQTDRGELQLEDARRIGAQARAGKLTAGEQKQEAEAAKQATAAKREAKASAKTRHAEKKGPTPSEAAPAGAERPSNAAEAAAETAAKDHASTADLPEQRSNIDEAADAARTRVLQLGLTAVDWANTLRLGCTEEELTIILDRLTMD